MAYGGHIRSLCSHDAGLLTAARYHSGPAVVGSSARNRARAPGLAGQTHKALAEPAWLCPLPVQAAEPGARPLCLDAPLNAVFLGGRFEFL
jgi:hypothetical protein